MNSKKNTENSRPTATNQECREVRETDNNNCQYDDKKYGTIIGTQFLAGTEVRIVEFQGIKYIPEIDVADGLDQDRWNFTNLLKRNKEILNDYPRTVMVTVRDRPHKMRLLSFENTRRAIMMVDHNVKDPVRKEFLIERKRLYFHILDDFLSGASSKSEFDIDSFDISRKGMSSLNGIRIRLQGMLAKQRHPSRPDTVRRKIDMFRRDHRVMKGHDNMEKGWRNNEPEEGKIKLTGWVAFGIYSFARGHLEPDEQSRDLKEFYATCPELRPDYLPDQLDKTKQMKLLKDDNIEEGNKDEKEFP